MMLFQIKNWWSGCVLFELECGSLKICLEAAVKAKANLRAADLRAADLRDANLSDANLSGADLRAVDLRAADLRGTDLRGTDLRAADLRAADLRDANLSDANLSGADLRAVDLRAADLRGTDLRGTDLRAANLSAAKNMKLPTGETWADYLTQTVPALLTAGGRPLSEVATAEHWNCHDWGNCPMAAAFGVSKIDDVPILYRPRAEQFVQLFDANQIKLEDILPKAESAS